MNVGGEKEITRKLRGLCPVLSSENALLIIGVYAFFI
jgi:hypothetical protein